MKLRRLRELLPVVVDTPRGSPIKFKYDVEQKRYTIAHVLPPGMVFPFDFGSVPGTLADDGDPLDALILLEAPTFAGCLVEVRPVGIFHLVDRGVNDEKIIAVPTHDPFTDEIRDINDIRSHALREIEHFFEVYKDLENVRVRSRGFDDAKAARRAITESVSNYRKAFGAKGRRKTAKSR